jgi:hypothetical protein
VTISPPFPKPVRCFFRTTKNYQETILLYPDAGVIPLGRDLIGLPIEVQMFWVGGKLHTMVVAGPKGKTLEQSREMGMAKVGTFILDEYASTTNVWVMTRAMLLVLIGAMVEVTEVRTNPASGIKSYPILVYVDEKGAGICPECKYAVYHRPAFPVGKVYRCPSCHAQMVHREGRLDVLLPVKEA